MQEEEEQLQAKERAKKEEEDQKIRDEVDKRCTDDYLEGIWRSLDRKIVMDPFCYDQFKGDNPNVPYDREDFIDRVNEHYLAVLDKGGLKDGYAPFCKHLFIENFTEAISNVMKITDKNMKLLRSKYISRNKNELPVMVRWFDRRNVPTTKATILDIILYSKEQSNLEHEAQGTDNPFERYDYDYAIVSVKRQNVDYEMPMAPITMMRNALGKEFGGSGVKLDAKKYKKSIEFWNKHAVIQ